MATAAKLVFKVCALPPATWHDMHRPPMGLGHGRVGGGYSPVGSSSGGGVGSGFGMAAADVPRVVFHRTGGGGRPRTSPVKGFRDDSQSVIVLVPPPSLRT